MKAGVIVEILILTDHKTVRVAGATASCSVRFELSSILTVISVIPIIQGMKAENMVHAGIVLAALAQLQNQLHIQPLRADSSVESHTIQRVVFIGVK